MLDPYIRATLAHDGAGRFAATVKVPDAYGVFKWDLQYRRLGYSYIDMSGALQLRAHVCCGRGWWLCGCGAVVREARGGRAAGAGRSGMGRVATAVPHLCLPSHPPT